MIWDSASPQSGPRFEGKPLGHWLALLDGPGGPPQARSLAETALRQMGTNAIPELLAMLGSEDSFLKRQAMDWSKSQELIPLRIAGADRLRWRARQGLLAMGMPALGAAIPGLEALVLRGRESGWVAAQCLAATGRAGLPALRKALGSPNPTARLQALTALRYAPGAREFTTVSSSPLRERSALSCPHL